MQRLFSASAIGLALTLAGCSNDPEETPDITEAIPLTQDENGSVDGAPDEAGVAGDGGIVGDAAALPSPPSSGDAGNTGAGQRAIPDTMEAGSNPPDFSGPPKGSKVQHLN